MITKMKVLELILDWDLWPRFEAGKLDTTNIRNMKVAITAGIKLPPVVADKKTYRVIDGFHRVKAYLSLYGNDAEIDVDLRSYKNDADMLLESARINSKHGLPLSPRDRVHVILRAREYKIPIPVVAESIGMDGDSAKKFLNGRTAMTKEGKRIALSGGSLSLKQKTLTEYQEQYVQKTGGNTAGLYARMLINQLKIDAIIFSEKTIITLSELKEELDRKLLEVAS